MRCAGQFVPENRPQKFWCTLNPLLNGSISGQTVKAAHYSQTKKQNSFRKKAPGRIHSIQNKLSAGNKPAGFASAAAAS